MFGPKYGVGLPWHMWIFTWRTDQFWVDRFTPLLAPEFRVQFIAFVHCTGIRNLDIWAKTLKLDAVLC